MNFADLRTLLRIHVDDPQGSELSDDEVRVLLQQAYSDLLNLMDQAPGAWFLDGPWEQAVVAGTREYRIELSGVRRIVDLVRVQNDREVPVDTHPFVDRFRFSSGVYVFRSDRNSTTAHWYVGMCGQSWSDQTLHVWYVPDSVANLPGRGPAALPTEFHYLVALRGGLLWKQAKNRDATMLASLYAKGESELRSYLGTLHSRQKATPI